jgi:hypothetical protein
LQGDPVFWTDKLESKIGNLLMWTCLIRAHEKNVPSQLLWSMVKKGWQVAALITLVAIT